MSNDERGRVDTSAVADENATTRGEAALHDRGRYAPLAHHGNTPAAWAGSIIAGVGFVVAAAAFVLPGGISWPVFWAGLVVVLLGPVVGLIMRNLGYGTREL